MEVSAIVINSPSLSTNDSHDIPSKTGALVYYHYCYRYHYHLTLPLLLLVVMMFLEKCLDLSRFSRGMNLLCLTWSLGKSVSNTGAELTAP